MSAMEETEKEGERGEGDVFLLFVVVNVRGEREVNVNRENEENAEKKIKKTTELLTYILLLHHQFIIITAICKYRILSFIFFFFFFIIFIIEIIDHQQFADQKENADEYHSYKYY